MTRLEFVSMSLIKGLKGVIYIDGEQEIVTLKSIDTDGNEIWVSNDNWVYSSLNYDIKIICRKLSDLTKEIYHGEKMFVPTVNLGWNTVNLSFSASNIKMAVDALTIHESQKLIEWKFNLMDENEPFIDVNTLEVNPYK